MSFTSVPVYVYDMTTNAFYATSHFVGVPTNASPDVVGFTANHFMTLFGGLTESFHVGMKLFGMG